MAITIKPTNIVGYSIDGSVGRNGKNAENDIFTIKNMLNRITPENGGAGGLLDEDDTKNIGPEFQNLVNQIEIFQRVNFPPQKDGRANPFYFAPDGLIQPGRSTIRKMRALIGSSSGGIENSRLSVKSASPISGECDMFGFSAARLERDANYLWSRRSFTKPYCQFVPLGESRTLIVKTANSDGDFLFHVHNDAFIKVQRDGSKLIINGIAPGTTIISIEGEVGGTIMIQIIVRAQKKCCLM
jgi:hypothetical protein